MKKSSKRKSSNVYEKRAEELQKHIPEDEKAFSDYRARGKSVHRRPRAPYISPSWLQDIIELNRRQNIPRIDKEFINLRIVGSGNESKVIAALRFLELVDDDLNTTSKFASLKVMGNAFKENLTSVINDAYGDLVSTVVLDRAKPFDLINFFIQRYNYSQSLARLCTKLFVWLASQSNLTLSQNLLDFNIKGLHKAKSISEVSKATEQTVHARVRASGERPQEAITQKGRQREMPIQASVTIQLDKDTPREYWDRVLALLGEKRDSEAFGSYSHVQARKQGLRSDLDHVEAWLFYDQDVDYIKGERDPKKLNPRHKLVVNNATKKAYFMDSATWKLVKENKIRWHSDNVQDLEEWCVSMGYQLMSRDARLYDLLAFE